MTLIYCIILFFFKDNELTAYCDERCHSEETAMCRRPLWAESRCQSSPEGWPVSKPSSDEETPHRSPSPALRWTQNTANKNAPVNTKCSTIVYTFSKKLIAWDMYWDIKATVGRPIQQQANGATQLFRFDLTLKWKTEKRYHMLYMLYVVFYHVINGIDHLGKTWSSKWIYNM